MHGMSTRKIRLRLLAALLTAMLVIVNLVQLRLLSEQGDPSIQDQIDQTYLACACLTMLELGLAAVAYVGARRLGKWLEGDHAKLEENEWFARLTLDALSAQVAVLDETGCIVRVNQAWRDGFRSEDPMLARERPGTNYLAMCDTLAGQGHEQAAAIAGYIRSLASGQKGEAYAEYRGKVGEEVRWNSCRVTRFPDSTVVRIVMAHEDITARKRAEEAVEQAKAAADAANQSKSAFLANMSHEIRTPMTAILGYGDLLLDPNQSTQDRSRCVQVIRRNGEHLLRLINDVLDISKIEANKYDIERIRTDLRQLLSDVVSLTRVKAIQKGLNFKVTVDGTIPKEVQTDPMRLKQILVNLIGNAIKFTSSGGVYLRVSWQDSVAASTLHVDVLDTGIGMNAEQMQRIFRPFSQADESTTRKFGGTGLGLVISRRFAQLLGGDIVVESEEGIGTCFSVWVDAGSLQGVRMLPSLDEADLVAAAPVAPQSGKHFAGKVLVAEDGEDNQQLISLLLGSVGAQVVLAPNGLEAIRSAESQDFDLVLMDMQMPELDGYSTTRRLRESGYTKPIVALTANAMADDRSKCLGAGCDDYLPKPLRLEQLMEILSRYLKTVVPAASDSAASEEADTQAAAPLCSSLANNEKLKSVLDRFVNRLPERIEEMQKLIRAKDLERLARTVHQMKGAAGGYGFPEITVAAGSAEDSIKRADDISSIVSQVDQLVRLIRRVDGFPQSIVPPAATTPTENPIRLSTTTSQASDSTPAPRIHVDMETGLANRAMLQERLSAEIAIARRTRKPLACIAIRIADLGLPQGRQAEEAAVAVIQRIAGALEERCQTDCQAFRADPSHLVVLAPGRDNPGAEKLAGELGELIAAQRFADIAGDVVVRCVFGIGLTSLMTSGASELLASAMKPIADAIRNTLPEPTRELAPAAAAHGMPRQFADAH